MPMMKRPLGLSCLLVSLLAVFLNWVMTESRGEPFADYGAFRGREVRVTGRVYKKETVSQASRPMQVIYLRLLSDTAGGNVICYLKEGQELPEMGSAVLAAGKLSDFERASNPGQFDARSYYQVLNISYRLNQTKILTKTIAYDKFSESLYRLRCFLADQLEQCLPKEDAAVMQTMLLGEKGSMEKELKALYQRNGIAHVLAISGLHVSMLGMGLYKLLRRCGIPMKAAAAAAVLVMLPYGMMTGFAVSAVRAILMFTLRMAAVMLNRSYDMLTAVGAAALLLILQQPLYWKHSGFLFSFGCVAGIGILVPALTAGRKLNKAAGLLLPGAAVTIITLPVYLWFYDQFPPYSFLLNLLVIPLMSLLMAAGLWTLAMQLIFPPAGIPAAFLISGILRIYETLCRITDQLPANVLIPGRPEKWRLAVYMVLLLLIILLQKKLKRRLRFCMAGAALFLLMTGDRQGLTVTFLDVGQGDCIYVEDSGQGQYLIDGGSSSVRNVGEYRIIPFLKFMGASTLEAVFVTHSDEDHCSGVMELLEPGNLHGIRIKNLVLPNIAMQSRDPAYLRLEQAAEAADVPVSYISRGQSLTQGELTFTCLHPEKGYETEEANEYSTVLGLRYGSFSALLTGDVEGDGERRLRVFLENNFEVQCGGLTVLKAAHHGSRYSTQEDILELLNPALTVISCGAENSYGHPHKELLERLEECRTETVVTDEAGAVTVNTDGRKVQVSKFIND